MPQSKGVVLSGGSHVDGYLYLACDRSLFRIQWMCVRSRGTRDAGQSNTRVVSRELSLFSLAAPVLIIDRCQRSRWTSWRSAKTPWSWPRRPSNPQEGQAVARQQNRPEKALHSALHTYDINNSFYGHPRREGGGGGGCSVVSYLGLVRRRCWRPR